MQAPDTDNLSKLYALIKDIKFAMLTTVDAQGHLRSRPMGTMEAEKDGHIWFFTAVDSVKVDELRREHRVNLSYAAPNDNRYVSVSGVARLVDDREKIRALWNPGAKLFFEGPDDPRLGLLRVTPSEAEYWSSNSTWIGNLIQMAVAKVTGDTSKLGENEKIKL